MSDKKEDCLCSAMKTAFLIILILVVFFLGYSFIYYSNMDYSSKLSSGFSFLSSLGILGTIWVYFAQKRNNTKIENERLCNKEIAVKKIFKLELDASILIYEEISNLIDFIKNKSYTSVRISEAKELVTFYVHNGRNLVGQFHVEKHSTTEMKDLLLSSVDIDGNLYHQLLFCYNSIVTSNWFLNTFLLFHKTIIELMKCNQKNIIITKSGMELIIFNTTVIESKYNELLIEQFDKLKEIKKAYYL